MTSFFWKALFENMGSTLKCSSAFHPQTDGQSEEANSTFLDLLKCYVSKHKATWKHYQPLVETIVGAQTGISQQIWSMSWCSRGESTPTPLSTDRLNHGNKRALTYFHLTQGALKLFIASAKRALPEFWNQQTKSSNEGSNKLQQFDETLCCLLECFYQESLEECSDLENLHDLIKMIVDLLQVCHRKSDCGIKSQSLKYLSGIWQKMQPEEIRSVIVPLRNLIVTKNFSESEELQIKLSLAEALAGLGEVSMSEDETDPTNCALWELYHVILRERHWAYAHLALASFGYFVAHTSWNELWRFVPSDAALAYDGENVSLAKESIFMTSLRRFLEKEVVCTTSSKSDVKTVQPEGELLETSMLEFYQVADKSRTMESQGMVDCCDMNVDSGVHADPIESSLPPEISNAMSMLQEGLLLLKEKLPTWFKESGQNSEQQQHMHDQLSLLADVIAQLHVLQPL
ncbi:hypothetical protein L7F22_048013 [Adiantum nelumboides]|nr:hypothetical protein [Adiantum nelumboides]